MYETIRELHDGHLPRDFIFEKVYHALHALDDYEVESDRSFEDNLIEMVDYMTPIYTYELNQHHNDFPEWTEIAEEQGGAGTVSETISMACAMHCEQILTTVWDAVKGESE